MYRVSHFQRTGIRDSIRRIREGWSDRERLRRRKVTLIRLYRLKQRLRAATDYAKPSVRANHVCEH